MKTCCVARKSNGLPEGFPYTSSQGIAPLSVLLSLLFSFLLQAVPFSAADDDSSDQRYYDGVFNEKQAAVIFAAYVFAFCAVGVLAHYGQRCLQPAASSASQQGRRLEGLDRSEIESLPTIGYLEVKNLNIGERAPDCAVCLAEFTDEAILRLLPKCHHAFHSDCIDTWLTGNTTCPVCRCVLSPLAAETPAGGVELTAPPIISNGEVAGSDRGVDLEANAAENWDRFRLRLPEEVRKKILVDPRSARPGSSNVSERDEAIQARGRE